MLVVKRVMVERTGNVERDLVVALEMHLAVVTVGRGAARADDRVLVGEAREEAVHLDDQVGEDGQVRQRLDRNLRPVVLDRAHASERLAAVDLHAAGAARGVQAGMPESQRRIAVVLDPAERIEHGRVRTDRDLELVEALAAVAALVAVDAEAADVVVPVLGYRGAAGRMFLLAHGSLLMPRPLRSSRRCAEAGPSRGCGTARRCRACGRPHRRIARPSRAASWPSRR